MRRIIYLISAIIALLTSSCQSNDEQDKNQGEASLTFLITNYEQTCLDSITTRGSSVQKLAHLSFAVYDASSLELMQTETTNSGDDDYGTFSLTLPYGKYILVFLGYDGSRTANMENPKSISFADEFVPNLFLKSMTMDISSTTSESQTVTLSRAVACFSLICDGDIPSNLAKMEFTIKGGSGTLNALTGYADRSKDRTYKYSNLSAYAGASHMEINSYTFLTAESTSMDYTVKATDSNEEEIKCRTFSNVPMKINQRSRYTGSFFSEESSSQGFSLEIENDVWEDVEFTY